MTAEAVKVIVRCRPLNEREQNLKCKEIIFIDTNRGQCSITHPTKEKDPPKNFFFDGSYGTQSTTEQIYADIVYPLVEGVTEGYNGTIFAYGQTGCGKSFTMQGVNESIENKGITPRSFEHIFETTAASSDVKYLMHATFLEIYNEDIRDLLGKDIKTKYDIKEHPDKGVIVSGLSMHNVKNVEDCKRIMEVGWRNRSTGATLMNADSSRSHSIFTIFLEMAKVEVTTGREMIRAGKLNLVDLAGSERQSKTGAIGDRLKEATKINLSLSALGNVISSLVDANTKHVPYRDSKLTRLLQDSLGGNTKTLMIACLSPADNNYEESLSTLRYANRAKNIKNKPVINEDPKDALLREYQIEINRLKSMLADQVKIPIQVRQDERLGSNNSPELQNRLQLNREKASLKQEYEKKLLETESMYVAEAANSAKLKEDLLRLKEMYERKLKKIEESFMLSTDTKLQKSLTVFESDEQLLNNGLQTFAAVQLGSRKALDSECLSVLKLDKLFTSNQKSADDENDDLFKSSKEGGSSTSRTYKVSETQRSVDELTKPIRPQFAVHLATTSLVGHTTPLNGISGEYDKLTKDDLLKRLHLLEKEMVGGEQANNKEIRERRSNRQRHAEEWKRHLTEANAKLDDDDGIMVGIYESIQDELRHKSRLLEKEKSKVASLTSEIDDLQCEFERDREDYLESIRRQNKHISLLQTILDRLQPCIRKDSNYANIDKIKKQAIYDDDASEWILPSLCLERTIFPITTTNNLDDSGTRVGANVSKAHTSSTSLLNRIPWGRDSEMEKDEEDRLYAKLTSRVQNHTNYFANKRKDQLLMDAAFGGSSRKSLPQFTNSGEKQSKDSTINNSNMQYLSDRAIDSLSQIKRTTRKNKRNGPFNRNLDNEFCD